MKFIQSISIGGSYYKRYFKYFKISLEDAEKVKKSFNKSNTEFSYNSDKNKNVIIKEILKKDISIDLLKKLFYTGFKRLDLSLTKPEFKNFSTEELDLFLIGDGSILFDNNSFISKINTN